LKSLRRGAINCAPAEGRLRAQAKARLRAGGRPAAMSAGDDFNRRVPSVVVDVSEWKM